MVTADDGADLTADGGDVLSAAERESLARTIYEASDAYDFDGVAWEHQYGATKREAYAQADAVLAARAAADEEAAAVRAENARLREQVAAVRALADLYEQHRNYAVPPSAIRQALDAPTAAQPEHECGCEEPSGDGDGWYTCPPHRSLTATQPEQGGAS